MDVFVIRKEGTKVYYSELQSRGIIYLRKMVQTLLVFLIFAAALAYVGRLVYRNFQSKSSCSSGCAKCSIDFSGAEQKLSKKT
jgi:hypothetical protein